MTIVDWRAYDVGHCLHPECMVRRGGALAARRFPSLAFRLRHPAFGDVLFDTGYSHHFFDATRRFPERLYRMATPVHLGERQCLRAQLEAEGIAARDIAGIVLSHLHGDHVGGLLDFPDAPLWCARAAWHDLAARGRWSALRIGLLPALLGTDFGSRCRWIEALPRVAPPETLTGFGDGHDLLGDGSLIAVPLPGHAAGHCGLAFRDRDGWVFLVGDAAWSSSALRDRALPPRFTTGWLGDTGAYRDTFLRLSALMQAQPGLRLVPSHCLEWCPRD